MTDPKLSAPSERTRDRSQRFFCGQRWQENRSPLPRWWRLLGIDPRQMRLFDGPGMWTRFVAAGRFGFVWRTTTLHFSPQGRQTLPGEGGFGIGGLGDFAKLVRVIAQLCLQPRLDRGLGKNVAGVLRDVLQRTDHRVGLLGQMKQKLDRLDVDQGDSIEGIDGCRETGSYVIVEVVDPAFDLRGRVSFSDPVGVDLAQA